MVLAGHAADICWSLTNCCLTAYTEQIINKGMDGFGISELKNAFN